MIRRESAIASSSMSSTGTRRWPVSSSTAVRSLRSRRTSLVLDALARELARDAAARAEPVRAGSGSGRASAATVRGVVCRVPRRHGRVRVVTDTTHYLPPSSSSATSIAAGVALRQLERAARTGSPTLGGLRRLLRAPGRDQGPADHLAALGRGLPRGLRADPRGGRRHRVDPPLRRHLGDRAGGRAGARSAGRGRASTPARIAGLRTPRRRAAGIGLVAMAARRRGRGGRHGAPRSPTAARAMRADLKTWFAVDTLEFLRRGGRIGSAQAYLGSALQHQADPHARQGDRADRARPHRRRAPWRA